MFARASSGPTAAGNAVTAHRVSPGAVSPSGRNTPLARLGFTVAVGLHAIGPGPGGGGSGGAAGGGGDASATSGGGEAAAGGGTAAAGGAGASSSARAADRR